MKRLELMDYARLIAAIAVIFYHYCSHGVITNQYDSFTLPQWVVSLFQYGYLGVPFFFMISGYVIFFSATNRTAGKFLGARVTRLYPTFWVCMTITAVCIYLWGIEGMIVYGSQYLAHFTMLPRDLGHPYIDGVYWTLYWEIHFYLMVFGLLFLRLGKHLKLFFLLWPVLMLAAWLVGWHSLPYLGGHYPFFAAGAVFAIMKTQATTRESIQAPLPESTQSPRHASRFSLASLASLVSLACSFILCFNLQVYQLVPHGQSQIVIAAFLVGCFAFFFYLNTAKGSSLKLPGAMLAGALTYPVYLIHQEIGYIVLQHMATPQTKYLWIIITILGVFGVSWLVHIVIERKLAGFWKWLFGWTVTWPVEQISAGIDRLVAMVYRPGPDKQPVAQPVAQKNEPPAA